MRKKPCRLSPFPAALIVICMNDASPSTHEIERLRVGLKWQPLEGDVRVFRQQWGIFRWLNFRLTKPVKKSFDLDLICLVFDTENRLKNIIGPETSNLVNENTSIFHSGDETDGVGIMDDEDITVQLKDLPPDVKALFFLVHSNNHNFRDCRNAECRVFDVQNNIDLHKHEIGKTEGENTRSLLFLRLMKDAEGHWEILPIEKYGAMDFLSSDVKQKPERDYERLAETVQKYLK